MISRAYNPLILLNKKKSILLLGPRGTGKTALISSSLAQVENVFSIDLLRGEQYRRYLHNPSQLGNEIREHIKRRDDFTIVAIDEIQKIPALLDEIHSLIEGFKSKLVFLLTGSSARKLRRSGANLLAGRAITKELFPLSQLEINLDISIALQRGTLPEIYLNEKELSILTLNSYVSTYLNQEIQQEALVRGIDRFSKFLELAAQLNGEPINFAKLGKQLGIAGKTTTEYFSILIDTLIVKQVPGWAHSLKKQLLQAPKFYFFDCGVLNALNGFLRSEILPSTFLYGRLFETFIVNQIFAVNEYYNLGLRFYYWRDKNGQEVDLIIARNSYEPLLAIEIKSSTQPDFSDCKGFQAFTVDYPKVPYVCLCQTPRAYSEQNIKFISWKDFLPEIKTYFLG